MILHLISIAQARRWEEQRSPLVGEQLQSTGA
jgi:hypothetical protein